MTPGSKKPARGPGQKTVTISLGEELLRQIDARCNELDEDRSSYLRKCARLEIKRRLLGADSAAIPPVSSRSTGRK